MAYKSFAADVIQSYGLGQQQARQRQHDDIVSTYLPQALRGNREAAIQVAGVDAPLGVSTMNTLDAWDDRKHQKAQEKLGELAARIGEKPTAESIESVKAWGQENGVDPTELANLTPESAQQVRMRVLGVAGQLAAAQQKRKADLDERIGAANINQSNASADLSNANAAFIRSGKMGPQGRPLPVPATEKLSDAGRTIQILRDASGAFKDDFGSMGVMGAGGQNRIDLGSVAPGFLGFGASADAVAWWKQYQNNKNAVRHALFGGALTPNEQAQFDAADITPNMAPEVIRQNLGVQAKLAAQGVRRLGGSLAASGYNPAAINEASGLTLDEAGQIGQTGQFDPPAVSPQGGTPAPSGSLGPARTPAGGGTPVALPPRGQPLVRDQLYQGAKGPVVYLGKNAQGQNMWQAAQQ